MKKGNRLIRAREERDCMARFSASQMLRDEIHGICTSPTSNA